VSGRRIIAGVDVGNSTTEIVLAEVAGDDVRPLAHASQPTRGVKGSPQSLDAAARLLLRLEARSGSQTDEVVLARLHPVRTTTVELKPRPDADTGVVRLDRRGTTPGGSGFAAGEAVPIAALEREPDGDATVIACVDRSIDFDDAAARLRAALARGHRVVGALLEGDDAVLVANRLDAPIPIVDEVGLSALTAGARVALEVAPPGSALARLVDPLALAAALDLGAEAVDRIAPLALALADERAAAVTRASGPRPRDEEPAGGWVDVAGDRDETVRLRLPDDLPRLAGEVAPGAVRAVSLPGVTAAGRVRDVFAIDLRALGNGPWVRHGAVDLAHTPLALLTDDGVSDAAVAEAFAVSAGRPARVVCSEPHAAWLGAMTTPAAPRGAVVCDIGGGTIDLAARDRVVTAAGAGELLTVAVAGMLATTRGVAEHAKRGPALRVEGPELARYEDSTRDFLETPAPAHCVGRLCVRRPGGLLPFADALAPEEWRSLRLAVKELVVGANVARCLDELPERPSAVLLCGGAALDDELTRIVAEPLRTRGIVVGRADVAGVHGPRAAVALGLIHATLQDCSP
jgi:hypothetical protein